ncbi:hypothetical protein A9798_06110 [Edwardsiella hoshinae]|uniref:Inner membrane protein ykgB n=1 Tax=Edwardsiella hoshinae TaxID=93378 RepID=A0ABN4SVI5_9GAMM|nr:DUF417 family protein [Edwardsiella hoshinae]AOV96565.1 hypothetical protein A9798_06110 [Edwardsiella hoshinae]
MKSCQYDGRRGELIGLLTTALILIWLGVFKFTPTEAAAIKPLVEHHFLMAWLYATFSIQTVSNLIGLAEIVIGVALLIGLKQARIGLYAGLAACVIFAVTLSFMFTTPDVFKVVDGIPITEFFLFKDLAFFGISLSSVERNRATLAAATPEKA